MKILYHIFCGLFCSFYSQSLFGQIELTLNGRQPYPVFAENYIVESDVITARIKNLSSEDIDVKVFASITGPYGISLESNEPTCIVSLISNQLQTFSKNNFDDLCININFSNIEYGDLSTEQRNALVISGILPEGDYTYCLTLKDALTNQEIITNCLEFEINFPDRPTIISPQNESNINGNLSQSLNVIWNHVITDQTLRMATSYNLKIVALPNNAGETPTVNEATILLDDSSISPFEYREDVSSPYAVFILDLPFISGDYYAVRITATIDGFTYPPSQAQSNVVIFQYIEEDFQCGLNFSTNPIYPAPNSVIPFKSIAPVLKFDSYCDKYSRFKYKTNIKENGEIIKTSERTLNWRKGPKEFFERRTEIDDPDGYYSSHISTSNYDNLPVLTHGKTYSWDANGYMQLKSGKKFNYNVSESNFSHGMPKLKLTSPVDGQEITPGDIQFQAVHDEIPENPLPPYKVRQIIDTMIHDYLPLEVHELAIFQLSDSPDFDTIYFASTDVINTWDTDYLTGQNNRFYNYTTFIAFVYKDLNFTHNLSDTLTYYWRIGWASDVSIVERNADLYNPLINPFYEVSDVGSFKIKSSSSSSTSEPEPTTVVNDPKCSNPCELPDVANTTDYASNIGISDEIKIGNFKMEIVEINKTGNTYSGEGFIKVPFIKDINAKVTFQNIKVNTDKVVYEGNATGKQGGNELEGLSSVLLGQTVELPFGWDTTINQIHVTAGITELTFMPTNAFMEMTLDLGDVLSNLIYESDNYPVISTNVCISPGGFEKDVYFYHQNTITLDENESGYGFEFKGGNSLNDTLSMTYVRWGCDGFKEMQLGGAVIFSQALLLKDSGNTSNDVPINERVRGHFTFKYKNVGQDMMITARMEDFQFAEYMEGWGFDTDTIFIDLSDLQNPPSFEAPEGYSPGYFSDPATANTWKGVYIPRIKVLSPKDFVNTNRSTMGYSTMIFGDGIYYLRHKMFNVVNEGIIGRMSATVDTIDAVISNVDFRFKMSGKLLLPFVEEGGYLSYSGLYNEINDWNFILKVGTDSLEVDIWKAYLRVYENSYFTLGKDAAHDNKFFIKTLINGHVSVDEDLLPGGGIKGLKNIKLPRIEFQNLGYESKVGFLGGAVFKKASPQKNINGFPIQLDSIALTTYQGNPGLYIEPKVVLAGDNSGFSGSVGLIFYGNFNATSPKDVFSDIDVFLSQIEIDAAVASCTFKGYLKFIDRLNEKGFEGALDATFPSGIAGKFVAKFGNYKSSPNAVFNTAQNYNYWYIDALIAFGKQGIPVYAGIDMYGIGGGMWYNMNQDNNYKIKPSELYQENATPTNTPSNSPIPYTRMYNSGYGLKIQGLFGDSGGGDKLNMLLALSAQFPQSGGPIIKLRGDVNIMSEISALQDNGKVQNTKKSLWGYAEIVYNGQEDFIHAELEINAKITTNDKIILEGSLPGYKVVDAVFHANTSGNSDWYFYIGRPEPEERGGIKLSLATSKYEVQSYFMMGHGVPNMLPEPDQEFMTMLENQESGYTSSQGGVNSVLNKVVSVGEGIAFGGVLKFQKKYDYQPFYLDVRLVLGLDINFTESTNKCLETGEVPGHNGWYGTGQLYAGLSGEFGIHIDLWFIECDKTLFNGSVATIMKGGLPNPSWFECRGTLRYDVAGLVRGSHSFEMQLGDKCTIGNGNPFGDMEIIADTNPKKDEKKVSIFTDPTISYAFPIGEELEFYDNKLEQYVSYKLSIEPFKLNSVGINPNINYHPTSILIEENFVSIHSPDQYLKSSTDHKMEVIVKAQEKFANNPWHPLLDGNSPWQEKRTVNFRTDVLPDSIPSAQILVSYPLQGQRYFMKGETENNKGFIHLKKSFPELFYTSNTTTGFEYEYYIEFRPISGPNTEIIKILTTITNSQTIQFSVNELLNNTKYIASLKRERKATMFAANPANYGLSSSNTVTTYKKAVEGKFEYEVLPARMVSLGTSQKTSDLDKTLFKFIFMTSKYSKLKDKLDALTWQTPVFISNTNQNINHKIVGQTEDFDEYDMSGYQINIPGNSITIPLIDANVHYLASGNENYGTNDFSFLNNDAIIEDIKQNYFWQCKSYESWKSGLVNPLKTTVQNLTRNLDGFQYQLSLNNLVKLSYNRTQNLLTFPQYDNNGLIMSSSAVLQLTNEPTGTPPPKAMNIRVDYWSAGLYRTIQNKTAMSSHLDAAGDIIEEHRNTLYRQMNAFVNSPLAFYLNFCKNTKIGLVYRIPRPSGYLINTKITKNYKTPGSCVQPDID